MLCLALALSAPGAERVYVVQKSDTLHGIARRYGFSAAQLASHNGIPKNMHVRIGQRLVIPSKTTSSGPAASPLGQSLQKAVDSAPVSPSRWKFIVIHHSGVNEGSLKSIDRYHREKRHMENGMAYHFLIGNGNGMGDGEIAVGNRWKEQLDGGHLRSQEQNEIALGICLIGDFDKSKPTKKQLEALKVLVGALMKRCKLSVSAVKTHQQINVVHTQCPGSKFPTKSVLADLKKPAT
jgi:N-acetyl-anhydromuramyl-L-alanine amidase AmpD